MTIAKANRKAAEYACLNFHYARTVPIYLYAYNIYMGNDWCGCILFGLGANNNMPGFIGCISGGCLELQRVALNGKQGHNATSAALSLAMKEVRKEAVLLQCLFSYADTRQNHTGTIYQATNWLYIGIGKMCAYLRDGYIYHGRTVSDIVESSGKTRQELGFRHIGGGVKYLYVYPYDKKLRKQLLARAKPYPKKEATSA
jgi:hypothetical protein